jgi:2-iminobutanoate/2-iminopropanoate deaminase
MPPTAATVEFINPTGLAPPVGPYSQAARCGDLLFCAGQLALDPDDSHPLTHLGAGEQTRIVLDNLKSVLEGAGSSLEQVLRTTVYLASLEDYGEMNAVYREAFPNDKPARATVEVAGLIGGLRVEIDAIAAASNGSEGEARR